MENGADPSSSTSGAPSSSSSAIPNLKEELLCPICYDPFREAVTLSCGHNFCKGCVSRSWENRRHACPVCKENSSLEDLRVNHTLNNLVEMILKEEGQRKSRGAALCPIHHEEPKFFCLEDKELACFACQNSKQHEGHKMKPVQEAAADFRAKLANMESSLRDKAKDFGTVRRSYESISRHNEVRSERSQRIPEHWSCLGGDTRKFACSGGRHRHSRLEQAAAIPRRNRRGWSGRGRGDSGRWTRNPAPPRANSGGILSEFRDLIPGVSSFLFQTHKNRKRRIACTVEQPEAVPSGMLLDVAKYLGSLQYNVWKKMLDTITAVPFSLDPNSAAGWLSVSEDLSSVSNRGYKLSVENPERFTSAPCILGSRGFSEGFHSWEVDLGGLTNWRVGVCRPHRDSHWTFHHDSRSGFWYIYHLPGKDECRASNAVRSEAAPGNLRRIRVELDCTEGELSFYDADLRSHIYTFHEKFGGVVFPYFYVGAPQGGGSKAKTLRICPLRVRVHEDIPV
ncbi:TRI35 protein, partial [Erpornis zantholeuca]|nr:TRI35 protein [Erpornis zantholeuca]